MPILRKNEYAPDCTKLRGSQMFRSIKSLVALATVFALSSCASFSQRERLYDTWIVADKYPIIKFGFTSDGYEELYSYLLARSPFLRNKIRIVDSYVDEVGNLLFRYKEYVSAGNGNPDKCVGYIVARISKENNQLDISYGQDAFPDSFEKGIAFLKLYRNGSPEALEIKEPASSTAFVVIDKSNPAYLDIIGLSDQESLSTMLSANETKEHNREHYLWNDFLARSTEILRSSIVRDQFLYPYLIPGIIYFLRQSSDPYVGGIEIGLTWNGGIAFTLSDYGQAEWDYEAYCKDPDNYLKQFSAADSALNPVYQFSYIIQ